MYTESEKLQSTRTEHPKRAVKVTSAAGDRLRSAHTPIAAGGGNLHSGYCDLNMHMRTDSRQGGAQAGRKHIKKSLLLSSFKLGNQLFILKS